MGASSKNTRRSAIASISEKFGKCSNSSAPNVAFLRSSLTVPRVSELLARAVERLVEQPEHKTAELVLEDLLLLTSTLAARCNELPNLLEIESDAARPLSWSA